MNHLRLSDRACAQMRAALVHYVDDEYGAPWSHACEGPNSDGSHDCRACHDVSDALIEAAQQLDMRDVEKALRQQLDQWRKRR